MKEDILEQITDDYLKSTGYFTKHNLKYRPDDQLRRSNPGKMNVNSDIDVLAIHPKNTNTKRLRVKVVNCKSWSGGFPVQAWIRDITNNKRRNGRPAKHSFREIFLPEWAQAFTEKVQAETGITSFTHVLTVTKLIGDKTEWIEFCKQEGALKNCEFEIQTLKEMLDEMWPRINQTPQNSDVGRLLQLIKASGHKFQIE